MLRLSTAVSIKYDELNQFPLTSFVPPMDSAVYPHSPLSRPICPLCARIHPFCWIRSLKSLFCSLPSPFLCIFFFFRYFFHLLLSCNLSRHLLNLPSCITDFVSPFPSGNRRAFSWYFSFLLLNHSALLLHSWKLKLNPLYTGTVRFFLKLSLYEALAIEV